MTQGEGRSYDNLTKSDELKVARSLIIIVYEGKDFCRCAALYDNNAKLLCAPN